MVSIGLRDRLLTYQLQCAKVLRNYFEKKTDYLVTALPPDQEQIGSEWQRTLTDGKADPWLEEVRRNYQLRWFKKGVALYKVVRDDGYVYFEMVQMNRQLLN